MSFVTGGQSSSTLPMDAYVTDKPVEGHASAVANDAPLNGCVSLSRDGPRIGNYAETKSTANRASFWEETAMGQPSLGQMLQIEQACDRFESAWQLGDRPRIEDYLQACPDLVPALLKPLLTIEVDYRRQRGESVRWGDYLPRFPQATEILTALLGPNLTSQMIHEQVTSLGLISPSDWPTVQASFGSRATKILGEDYLAELVESQCLTPFQAERLAAGKGKSLVFENFVLLKKLGQGGMGTVWKARERNSEHVVAVKVLDPGLTERTAMIGRFQREARVAMCLQHPNIVATIRAGEWKSKHFLVMEFIDGPDLSSSLKADGPATLSTALNWVTQIARGLDHAHRQGIIHRDIKLANLLRDTSDTIKILDLGLARVEGDEASNANLTGTGDFMGTADYTSPEQALCAKSADARSDIYSLGMVLWFLLLNRPAYDGKSLASRIMAHREAPIPSLAAAMVTSPSARDSRIDCVDALFRKMVAKNPADRFSSMAEVLSEIQAIELNE